MLCPAMDARLTGRVRGATMRQANVTALTPSTRTPSRAYRVIRRHPTRPHICVARAVKEERAAQPASTSGESAAPKIDQSPSSPAPEVDQEQWRVTPSVLADVITMFNTMPYEHDYWVDKAWVTGEIPRELRGTYLRNGPGLQVASRGHKRHFMDGDGCVLSLAFPGDGAMPRFTNRYVRTAGFVEEQAAGKPVHRNAFTRGSADGGRLFNPLDLNFKNVANTGVLAWGGRLWALWEVGRPYELCPRTLSTLGESDMDGQVGSRVAGHYRIIREPDNTPQAVLFGTEVSFTGMHLAFYECDPTGRVVAHTRHQLQGIGPDIMFVHDMLVTPHWYVVVMGPVQLDVQGFLTDYLLGKRSLAELLVYNKDKPSKVFFIPRPGKTPPAAAGSPGTHVVSAPPFFCFHHVNAYERDGGKQVVLDTISWQHIAFHVTQHTVTPAYYKGGCRSQLYRLVADLPTNTLVRCQRLVRRTLEFPAYAFSIVTGQPYRYAYFTGDAVDDARDWAPAQALVKVTLPDDAQPCPAEDPSYTPVPIPVGTRQWGTGKQTAARLAASTRPSPPAAAPAVAPGTSSPTGAHSSSTTAHASGRRSASPASGAGTSATTLNNAQPFTPGASRSPAPRGGTNTQPVSGRGAPTGPATRTPPTSPPRHSGAGGGGGGSTAAVTGGSAAGTVGGSAAGAAAPSRGVTVGTSGNAPGVVVEEWRAGRRKFPQEPMFVPRPGGMREDDGWILLGVHNAETQHGEIAILDAQRISEGPVAVIHLPHQLPVGLHGTWTPEYLGPDPDDPAVPSWHPPTRIRELRV